MNDEGPLRAAAFARLAALRARAPSPARSISAAVRDVVVVASSSRGGSSVFAEILRSTPELNHFQAEINPFLVIAGLTWPESGTGSDRLRAADASAAQRALLDLEMSQDIGRRAEGTVDRDAFAWALTWRLCAQWPTEDFDLDRVRGWVDQASDAARDEGVGPTGATFDVHAFHLPFLQQVRAAHPIVNPYAYDLDPARVAAAFPGLARVEGAPSPVLIEEPPFVPIRPWRLSDEAALSARPLMIKTPSNVYRLDFLRSLFPGARLRVLHLVRAPAASINGLYDGWRHAGFHAHHMATPLNIAGYTDHRPADARWWKFDLPPGWQDWTEAPLEQVCAFQWTSAHQATLDFLDQNPDIDRLQVRFEDVVGSPARRLAAFQSLADWLGVPLDRALLEVVDQGLPPIMATARPRQNRWYEKASLLGPVLATQPLRAVAERLGYATVAPPRPVTDPGLPATLGGAGYEPRGQSHREEVAAGERWRRVGVDTEYERLHEVLLCWPSDHFAVAQPPDRWLMLAWPDLGLLREQIAAMAAFYTSQGVTAHVFRPDVPPPPNSLFMRDLVFLTPEGAVLGRPAAAVRSGEERFAAEALARLGVPILRSCTGNATFEGADALWLDPKTVLIGVGRRTNAEGCAVVSDVLGAQGVSALPIAMPAGVQHLLGLVVFVDRDLALVHGGKAPEALRSLLRDRGVQLLVLPPDEELTQKRGMNAVVLGPRRLVMPGPCPGIQRALERAGIEAFHLDISEPLKAAGGLGCMTSILRRALAAP